MQEQIEKLKAKLAKIRGNDAVSRSRRASLRARIAEMEQQAEAEEYDACGDHHRPGRVRGAGGGLSDAEGQT